MQAKETEFIVVASLTSTPEHQALQAAWRELHAALDSKDNERFNKAVAVHNTARTAMDIAIAQRNQRIKAAREAGLHIYWKGCRA